ncbi:uncharacterized protein F5891DRAFT_757587 [Suillus fuscotomentosus]|uniref:Uncharacterized protein n=1 Tax=Suillus fuscotomentosus TaxID=1912939 RepID=A0AAD4HRE4_9AGAM|nr:uncharacterized protein F5891DRAFT_757587 [Suillus fuscotomentosus]KAG1904769.1 hypothetical protein F5891DRAFT_757587 [Suillus fuscotomentosus]
MPICHELDIFFLSYLAMHAGIPTTDSLIHLAPYILISFRAWYAVSVLHSSSGNTRNLIQAHANLTLQAKMHLTTQSTRGVVYPPTFRNPSPPCLSKSLKASMWTGSTYNLPRPHTIRVHHPAADLCVCKRRFLAQLSRQAWILPPQLEEQTDVSTNVPAHRTRDTLFRGTYGQVMVALKAAGLIATPCMEGDIAGCYAFGRAFCCT